jgi:ribosome-associated protein
MTRAKSETQELVGQPTAGELRVSSRIAVPLRELSWSSASSGGPGGQNVNRVRSKIALRWDFARSAALPPDVQERLRRRYPRRISAAGELSIASQRYRSAQRNAQDCLDKLRELLLSVARPPAPRRLTAVPRGSRERRLQDKQRRSRTKRERSGPPE